MKLPYFSYPEETSKSGGLICRLSFYNVWSFFVLQFKFNPFLTRASYLETSNASEQITKLNAIHELGVPNVRASIHRLLVDLPLPKISILVWMWLLELDLDQSPGFSSYWLCRHGQLFFSFLALPLFCFLFLYPFSS